MIFKHVIIRKKMTLYIIVKFKCRKQKRINRKNLCNKLDVLTQLNFSDSLFFSERMCHENHQLSYKCWQLKTAGKIHSTWFWNNSVNVKLNERSQSMKIHHVIDIEKLLGVDNLDEFIITLLLVIWLTWWYFLSIFSLLFPLVLLCSFL